MNNQKNDKDFQFFISCTPGLEQVLARECRHLNLTRVKTVKLRPDTHAHIDDNGGFLCQGDLSDIYRANLCLRTASRVIIRLGDFYAAAFSELRKKASRLNWGEFISPGQAVDIRVSCHKSRLYHSGAVAERVLGAINDHFVKQNSKKGECRQIAAGQMVLVRIVNDMCTISIDASGELLHRRGYRQAVAKAPLRETLAAAMIIASGWDRVTPLIDPFCGSGTIPIEAALLACNIPPGLARQFAFSKWPNFQSEAWAQTFEEARSAITTNAPAILGYDRDTGAVDMSLANAARSGQKDNLKFKSQAISLLMPEADSGWLITNPPYGVRVAENKDMRDLYARFGTILNEHFQGWQAGILSSDSRLTGNLGLNDPTVKLKFKNGGIPVQFLTYTLEKTIQPL